ncbi:MAG: LptF/LptG family permease [Opitutaceae bacterium]|nr:LptF/LptG family permease [Opitutaceae bacterium]
MNSSDLPVLMTYVARRALGPFAVLTAVLLFALTLERVLSLVQAVTQLGAPIYTVGELVAYLLPHYLGLAIPAAWFLGVLIGFRGLQRDSELTVMRASGVPLRSLLVPLLAVSLVLSLVLAGLTGYLQPYTRYAYRACLQELKRRDFWSKLQPSVFTPVEGNRSVIRVGAVENDGRLLKDFFASYQKEDRHRVFVSARQAVVEAPVAGRSDADTTLDLQDGMLVVREDPAEASPRMMSMSFEVFPWSLSETGLLPPYGRRGQDEREMTFGELLANNAPVAPTGVTPAHRLTEWHSRMVKCASVPMLAVLAVPLALLGRGRSSRAYGFVIGVVLLVLYQKIHGTGEAYGKLGQLSPGISVWFPYALFTVLAAALFHWFGGDRNVSAPRGRRPASGSPRPAG